MRKWPFLFAAAAVVLIGCGGGNSSTGSGTNTGGNTGGPGRASVAIPDRPALLQVAYLTGQGRAPGDLSAEITRLEFLDSPSQPLPEPFASDPAYRAETTLSPARYLGLEAFSFQTVNVNARVPSSMDSRFFDTFLLEVNQILRENNEGIPVSAGSQSSPALSESFPALIRAFQGRQTIVPIFLDSAMLNHNGQGVVFDRSLFEEQNLSLDDNAILGFLSDYVEFDISNVASRPNLNGGPFATRIYFSGDSIALSTQAGSSRPFEVLGPIAPVEGVWSPPTTVTPDFGTYSLMAIDPRDLTQTAKITSLMGITRPYTSVLSNVSTFEMITFPNSLDTPDQDMVMIVRNGAGQITNMYFGVVELDTLTFSAFPINQVDDGDASNEVTGTLSALVKVSADPDREFSSVRSGTFTVTGGALPGGFQNTGTFIVFRR